MTKAKALKVVFWLGSVLSVLSVLATWIIYGITLANGGRLVFDMLIMWLYAVVSCYVLVSFVFALFMRKYK